MASLGGHMKIFPIFLNYVHFISVSIFVGTLFFIRFISTPLMRKLEREGDPHANALLIGAAVKVVHYGWIALVMIIIDGALMMFTSSNYKGLFVVDWNNNWQTWMFIKHIVCGLLLTGFIGYSLLVAKNNRLLAASKSCSSAGKQMDILGVLNVCVAVGLLFCTAVIKYELVWPKIFLYGPLL